MKGWVRMIARIVNPELTFGMPLLTIVTRSKKRGWASDVPVLVVTLIQFLRDNDGVNVEGIFRMSGDQNSIKQLKSRFNSEADHSIVIPKETDVHVVTGTLKYFLRDLESALIPITCNSLLRAILALNGIKEKVIGFKKLVEGLPKENAATLQYILKYLSQIAANSSVNLMTTQNLAVVFGPCFIRSEPNAIAFQDADMQLNCVNSMIEQYKAIFPNEDLITNVRPASGTGTPISPATPGAAPMSAPPSFLPPPPNKTPPAAPPSSSTFRPAAATVGSREPAIVIGGHSYGAGVTPPGSSSSIIGFPPAPANLPPLPVFTGSDPDTDKFRQAISSRPPNFAPPSVPAAVGPTTTESPSSSSPLYGAGYDPTNADSGPALSSGTWASMYDSSSSDDEVEVVTRSLAEESPMNVVTSLDDITDLEGEDGSIDVSKMFSKTNMLPATIATKPRPVGWTAISKPSVSAGSVNLSYLLNDSPSPPSSDAFDPYDADTSEIATWLAVLGEEYVLYAPILEGEGFKTIVQLADINDDDMKELGIKMAHRKAMRAAIDRLKGQ